MSTPTNGWDRNIELLLANWSEQIIINEYEYRKRANFFKKLYNIFGVFGIIAQTGALTSLINAIASKDYGIILIIVAVLETLILIADGIDTFFNFGGACEKYYEGLIK